MVGFPNPVTYVDTMNVLYIKGDKQQYTKQFITMVAQCRGCHANIHCTTMVKFNIKKIQQVMGTT